MKSQIVQWFEERRLHVPAQELTADSNTLSYGSINKCQMFC